MKFVSLVVASLAVASAACDEDAGKKCIEFVDPAPKEGSCDAFKLMVYCSNVNGCLTDDFKSGCENYKKAAADCDVDCSSASGLSASPLVLAGGVLAYFLN